jgi:uncharacterized membrane protein YjgN (DUF898 family)
MKRNKSFIDFIFEFFLLWPFLFFVGFLIYMLVFDLSKWAMKLEDESDWVFIIVDMLSIVISFFIVLFFVKKVKKYFW